MSDQPDGPALQPPPPIRIGGVRDEDLPNEVEMPLVDHLEELRQRVLSSLLAVVVSALLCLLAVKPLVRLLEAPASGIHFLQLAPGDRVLDCRSYSWLSAQHMSLGAPLVAAIIAPVQCTVASMSMSAPPELPGSPLRTSKRPPAATDAPDIDRSGFFWKVTGARDATEVFRAQ